MYSIYIEFYTLHICMSNQSWQRCSIKLFLLWSAESWASMLHQSSSLVMNIANFLWVSRGPLAG